MTQTLDGLQVSMRELAAKALMREHGITHAQALGVLDRAALEAASEDPAARAKREVAERSKREAARLERLVGELEVPIRPEVLGRLVRGEALDTEPCRDVARWLSGPRRVLVMLGDMGTGKTVAACSAIVAGLRSRNVCVYVREADVVRWSLATTEAAQERMAVLRRAGMLVVDECEQTLAQHAEAAGIAVAQLVDARVRAGRTVLAGNMTVERFTQRYGRRCVDRIREIGTVAEYKLAEGQRSMRTREVA